MPIRLNKARAKCRPGHYLVEAVKRDGRKNTLALQTLALQTFFPVVLNAAIQCHTITCCRLI